MKKDPSSPHWAWLSNSSATDELQLAISHMLETSTNYLTEIKKSVPHTTACNCCGEARSQLGICTGGFCIYCCEANLENCCKDEKDWQLPMSKHRVIKLDITAALFALKRRKETMTRAKSPYWSVMITNITKDPGSVLLTAIRGSSHVQELIDQLADAGMLPLERQHISLWLGEAMLDENKSFWDNGLLDESVVRLEQAEHPPMAMAKVGTIQPRIVNSGQLQNLRNSGATQAELQEAMAAGIEGFRCGCSQAHHFSKQCSVWLSERGTCPVCQVSVSMPSNVMGERTIICGCDCAGCTPPYNFTSYPCTCNYIGQCNTGLHQG